MLDVGCAQLPNPFIEGVHCTGYDIMPTPPDSRFDDYVQGDVTAIADRLAGRRFDTIIAAELIEHLENPYAFLRDLRSLLAPGGRLLVSTPNPVGFPVFLLEWLRNKRWFYTSDHTYYLLPRWVERMLESSGWCVESLTGVGLWLPIGFVLPCPVTLSYQVIYQARAAT